MKIHRFTICLIASAALSLTAFVRTRPLCPYPQVAVYKGSGSIDDAANFTCQIPAKK